MDAKSCLVIDLHSWSALVIYRCFSVSVCKHNEPMDVNGQRVHLCIAMHLKITLVNAQDLIYLLHFGGDKTLSYDE